jgi:hypothetical protein
MFGTLIFVFSGAIILLFLAEIERDEEARHVERARRTYEARKARR